MSNEITELLDEIKNLKLQLDQKGNELNVVSSDLSTIKIMYEKTELLLQSSLESFNDQIILSVDQNYRYLYFNKVHKDTMIKLYNVEIEIGKSILDYISDIKDRNDSKRHYDMSLLGEHHSTIEDINGDNGIIIFEASYSPIYDKKSEIIGVSLFARDITARIKTQRALLDSEEKYRLLTKSMPLGMAHYEVIQDEKKNLNNYIFLEVNEVFENIFGVKNTEIIGKNIWDLYPETEQHWIDAYEHVANSGETVIFEDYTKETDSYLKIYGYKTDLDKIAFILQDITEERRNQKYIEFISYHDSLTKLHNRRFLFEEMNKLWRQSIRERNPISFIMIDIDDFKLYNDSYGHIEGDKALIKLANVFASSMARPLDIVGRYGGEEFLVVLPNTALEGAYQVAENIRKKIVELKIVHSEKCNNKLLSISLGVVSVSPGKDSIIEEAINKADIALFSAKEKGKNRTEKYSKK